MKEVMAFDGPSSSIVVVVGRRCSHSIGRSKVGTMDQISVHIVRSFTQFDKIGLSLTQDGMKYLVVSSGQFKLYGL